MDSPYTLPANHPYMMPVYNGQQQPHSLDSNQSTASSTANVTSAKDPKAVVTQTSSLPSSRRPSTNLTPGQMAAAIFSAAQVPQRVFIRVPVKDIGIQTDFPEDHSLMSGSSASSSSTSSVREHSELIEHTHSTSTTTNTLTSPNQLSLNQLSSKEQQQLLQQAVQHLLNGLRQSMMAAQGSQLYQQPAHYMPDSKHRASSVDHTNLLSQQSQSTTIAQAQSRLPVDHSATISACASDVYQSELMHSPFTHQNNQTLPFTSLIQQDAGSLVADQAQPMWANPEAFTQNNALNSVANHQLELFAVKQLLKQVCNFI